ncbi:MAG: hypothetical protein C4516_09575 [Oxalobacter sp.]|nr:MAG: hypothetical protein C4516_09575 [Oxalobacter sp.]
MTLHGVGQQEGVWFILHPAHFQIGHDHMIMADRRTLDLAETESRALFEAVLTSFQEAGKTLIYGNSVNWFVRADDWKDMVTTSPDMACGRNLTHWMPEGEGELAWRKLLNEVQMIWHTHPVNTAREARGARRINALWLWGGASGTRPDFPAMLHYIHAHPAHAYPFADRMKASGQFFSEYPSDAQSNDILRHPTTHDPVFLDNLIAPALAQNWGSWLSVYETLEEGWFAPILNALTTKTIRRVTLHLSNDISLKTFVTDAASQRKFWIRKSLAQLL